MSNTILYALWAALYILTAGLGFIPEAEGIGAIALTCLSILFFVPGFILLYRGEKKTVRLLSILSLAATVLCLVMNIQSVGMTAEMGEFLYILLGLVSAPMYCSQFWVLGMFGWSGLLMGSIMKLPTLEENDT